jgi:cystine transport system substrate-binding protein
MMPIRNSVFLYLLLLLGCMDTPAPGRQEAEAHAEMTIATDATFPPFHYVDDSGNVTGLDIELARELARRSGYQPRVIVIPYEQLFDDLLARRYQVVAATTGITPQREEKFLFTSAYFDTCQAALVRTGAGEPGNLGELAGRRVGAAGSGTSVAALSGLPESIPVLLSEREATEDTIADDGRVPYLENGEIDALVVDEMDAVAAARASNGRLRVLAEPVALEQYGFVLAPDSSELQRGFNNALVSMRKDGSLQNLKREFGLARDDDWPIDLSR